MNEWIDIKDHLPNDNQDCFIHVREKDTDRANEILSSSNNCWTVANVINNYIANAKFSSAENGWIEINVGKYLPCPRYKYHSKEEVICWKPVIYPDFPITPKITKELQLEVGKVYEDKDSNRYLIINKSKDNIYLGLLLYPSHLFYSTHYLENGITNHKPSYKDIDDNLLKLSDNQFPGVIDDNH